MLTFPVVPRSRFLRATRSFKEAIPCRRFYYSQCLVSSTDHGPRHSAPTACSCFSYSPFFPAPSASRSRFHSVRDYGTILSQSAPTPRLLLHRLGSSSTDRFPLSFRAVSTTPTPIVARYPSPVLTASLPHGSEPPDSAGYTRSYTPRLEQPSISSSHGGSFQTVRHRFPPVVLGPAYLSPKFSSLEVLSQGYMQHRSLRSTSRQKQHSLLRAAKHASGRLLRSAPRTLMDVGAQCASLLLRLGKTLSAVVAHPSLILDWCAETKEHIIHGIHWTRRGFKVFGANLKVSILLLKKKMKGQPLSYREHKLLVRTTSDLVKLIPFSFFVVVPFAELLLPVALWLFPGMLPSTFSERQFDNPYLQRKLKAKQELAQFFQELIAERTRQVLEESTCDRFKDRARLLREFQEKLIRKAEHEAADAAGALDPAAAGGIMGASKGGGGDPSEDVNPFLSVKETLKYAKLFREEFKLDNMPTPALLVLCEMLGLRPYRIRANIILQLRYHILRLQEEDREIMWEGVENLTHEELRDACRERAMRFYGVSDDVMRDQMTQWLTLSSHRDIPPLLLLWSRSITMTHSAPVTPSPLAEGPSGTTRPIVTSDDLLPVIDETSAATVPDDAKAREEQIHEEFAKIDRHLETLQDTARRLEEEHALLTSTAPTATATPTLSPKDDAFLDQALHSADTTAAAEPGLTLEDSTPQDDFHFVGGNTPAERARMTKEALLKRSQKLEKEMQLLRTVTDLQHEQVSLLIRSLANLIDLHRSGNRQNAQMRQHRTLEAFVNRLEKTVSSFEEGVSRVSNILEAAKSLNMSEEDQDFYLSEGDNTAVSSPGTSTSDPGSKPLREIGSNGKSDQHRNVTQY